MSDENKQKDHYAITTRSFQAYGGAIDNEMSEHINSYSQENDMRLLQVMPGGQQFVFVWVRR